MTDAGRSRSADSSLRWIGVGTLAIAGAYWLTAAGYRGPIANWCMVAGLAALTYATVSLGGAGRMALATRLIAALCVAAGFGVGLLSPFPGARLMGVPLESVVMLFLVGLVPLAVLPAIFAAADHPNGR